MSNNNNEDEPVIGSRLKMKIKFTTPSSSSAAAVSSAAASSEDHLVKNEPDQDPNCKVLDLIPVPTQTQTPSPTSQSPSSMGKRKKKPRKMHGEFVSHGKRMRKPFSKSDYVGSSRGPIPGRKRRSYHHDEITTPAMIRAEEVLATLSSEFPSFTKPMVKSHVFNGFWMGVPGYFSREHLPRMDTFVTLVVENEQEYQLKYIADKMGLSAGWRKFTIEQKLLEDDVLIFQLVAPCKFKVYVVRANDFNEVEGALSLLDLEAQIERNNNTENDCEEDSPKAVSVNTYKRRRMRSLGPRRLIKKKTRLRKSVPSALQLAKKFENGYKKADPIPHYSPNFENVENYEDFAITVGGLCIDSELPEDIRAKYYELCLSRNDFLHARLVETLNSKLIAGVICETVNISDAIRTCSLMTAEDEFENWEKTLKSFELLGMKVGFLRDRVRRLVELAFESDGAHETRRFVEAKVGRVRAEDEIVNLESKIIELKEASEKYNEDMEALKFKAESYETKFQEEVDAPW